MKESDLSPAMRKACSLLSESEKIKFLKEREDLQNGHIRSAIAQIQARNNSHGVGKHIKKKKN